MIAPSARVAALLLFAACGGVSHRVHEGVAAPTTVAVLPAGGPALPEVRATARGLATSWLMARGYDVLDTDWVDQALAMRGWLDGDGSLRANDAAAADLARALGAEAVLVLREVDESEFNVLLLRRHRVDGHFDLVRGVGGVYWSATHAVGSFGGLLLGSGQLLTEARAVAAQGAPMATLALVDGFVAEAVATLPERARREAEPGPSVSFAAVAAEVGGGDGDGRRVRLRVTAESTGGVMARFDVEGLVRGVPMVAVPQRPGTFRGWYDLSVADAGRSVRVHVEDAFGGRSAKEAVR